jgi:hypothetical protein
MYWSKFYICVVQTFLCMHIFDLFIIIFSVNVKGKYHTNIKFTPIHANLCCSTQVVRFYYTFQLMNTSANDCKPKCAYLSNCELFKNTYTSGPNYIQWIFILKSRFHFNKSLLDRVTYCMVVE